MKQTDFGNKTKLSVGYTLPGEGQFSFAELVSRYQMDIGEIYFAFPGFASGRSPLGAESSFIDYDATRRLVEELTQITKLGIRLNLLFNAACYGDDALSVQHQNEVCSVLDFLGEKDIYPTSATATSPITAQILHQFDPKLEVRASVNMRINTIKGIQYVEHLFDSFCIGRDINREPEKLLEIAEYLHGQGKTMSVLANSGCLRNCSMQSFHDNAVAHEAGIRSKRNLPGASMAGCREYLAHPEHRHAFLQNTWIRPEDLHHYDGVADLIKLATRMHALPAVVIDAYARRRYHGNLADLFEPGHGPLFAPYVIDNDRFPEDWYAATTACDKQCHKCNYCKTVWDSVLVNVNEIS